MASQGNLTTSLELIPIFLKVFQKIEQDWNTSKLILDHHHYNIKTRQRQYPPRTKK